MPGAPRRAADLDRLDLTDLGDVVLEDIAQGKLLRDICQDYGLMKGALDKWLEAPTRAEEVARARARGAAAMVEAGVAIADGQMPMIDPHTLEAVFDPVRDRLRIQSRQWIAERVDRASWGAPRQEVKVNLNVLHLDALRARVTRQDGVEDARILSETDAPLGDAAERQDLLAL